MRDRRSGAGGRREDGGMEKGSRRGKKERIDNNEERSREAGPQEVAGKRRDMTTVKGFPEVDKPLREGERTIKNELE